MELLSLTGNGKQLAKSTNGATNPNDPDYFRWRVIYALKFLHRADKDMIANYAKISPESVSLAITSLKQKGLVVGENRGGDVNAFI